MSVTESAVFYSANSTGRVLYVSLFASFAFKLVGIFVLMVFGIIFVVNFYDFGSSDIYFLNRVYVLFAKRKFFFPVLDVENQPAIRTLGFINVMSNAVGVYNLFGGRLFFKIYVTFNVRPGDFGNFAAN